MVEKIINIELSQKSQHIINIIASVLNMFVTTMISFVLSPYIVKTLGVEANGFISLANSFITYMTLVRTALNSMASRFLMLAYYKGEQKKFEQYYSSLFLADLILAGAFAIIGGSCVLYLENILSIPDELVRDVKILFILLFLNFIFATVITAWNTTTYIKNKLYLDSVTSSMNSAIRFIMIIALFVSLEPKLYFVGIATLIGGLVGYTLRYFYKRYLFPELRVSVNKFSCKAVKELLFSGVWNSISSLGNILTSSLDLLVTNLYVSVTAMGILSLSKVMPVFVEGLISSIASVFGPTLFMEYAKDDKESIRKTIIQSSKLITVFASLPLGFLLVYGKEFFKLWQPTQNEHLLYELAAIAILGRIFFMGKDSVNYIFTVVNKVRISAIITLLTGLVSIGVTFITLKYTELGIYAVALVSVICVTLKNIIFIYPYAAKVLNLKWYVFFETSIDSAKSCLIVCLIGLLVRRIIVGDSWVSLIIAGVVLGLVSLIVMFTIVLTNSERKIILNMIKRRKNTL